MIGSRYDAFAMTTLLRQHTSRHSGEDTFLITAAYHQPITSSPSKSHCLRDIMDSSIYTISSPCSYHLKTESSARVVILRYTEIMYSGSASAGSIFSRHHNTRASSEKRTFANFFRLGTLFPSFGFSFQHAEYPTMKRELAMFDRSWA
jgi:hypothetical protein